MYIVIYFMKYKCIVILNKFIENKCEKEELMKIKAIIDVK